MGKVISIINFKGGVGKTATTVQIAECLASEYYRKVLVIDIDPQTSSTVALIGDEKWIDIDRKNYTLYQVFKAALDDEELPNLRNFIQFTVSNLKLENLHLLPSTPKFFDIWEDIQYIPIKTSYRILPMTVLKQSISEILNDYDYILIDCPPTLGFLTQNALEISNFYLIPTIPDRMSTYGVPTLIQYISDYSVKRDLKLTALGILFTQCRNHSTHRRILEDWPKNLEANCISKGLPLPTIFKTQIPQTNTIAESLEYNIPNQSFKGKYKVTNKFIEDLTKEFIEYAK